MSQNLDRWSDLKRYYATKTEWTKAYCLSLAASPYRNREVMLDALKGRETVADTIAYFIQLILWALVMLTAPLTLIPMALYTKKRSDAMIENRWGVESLRRSGREKGYIK